MLRQKHKEPSDAKAAALEQFKQATKSGRWMAVYFDIDNQNAFTTQNTTCNFPHGSHKEAVERLQKLLDEDKGK